MQLITTFCLVLVGYILLWVLAERVRSWRNSRRAKRNRRRNHRDAT